MAARRGVVMAITLALINMKGGVGKSTLSLNLVYEYATAPWHKKVLLVDLDPQFNASQYILGQARYEQAVLTKGVPTTWNVFEQNTRTPGGAAVTFEPRAAVLGVKKYQQGGVIDLIPSRLELAFSLRNPAQKEALLAKSLAQISTDYDIIVIDCPPTESILTYAAYIASDNILVPVKPEYLSAIGLPLLYQSLDDFGRDYPSKKLAIAGIVFNAASDYLPEEAKAKREVRALAKRYGWHVFGAAVPYSRSFPKGAREGQPIFWTSYARTAPAQRFQAFASELGGVLGI
jgi:chromosome partitioning protein